MPTITIPVRVDLSTLTEDGPRYGNAALNLADAIRAAALAGVDLTQPGESYVGAARRILAIAAPAHGTLTNEHGVAWSTKTYTFIDAPPPACLDVQTGRFRVPQPET